MVPHLIYKIFVFFLFHQGIIGASVNMQPNSWYDVIMASENRDNFCFNNIKKQIDINNELKDKISEIEKELAISKVQNKEWETQIKIKDDLLKAERELIESLKTQKTSCNNHRELDFGIYNIQRIQIPGQAPFDVPFVSASAGWIVIQRRVDGSVDFDRDWEDYKTGFGDINGDYFIGLEKLYHMTQDNPHELYIRLQDINGTSRYARYDNFKIGSEKENYKLESVGNYTGTAGDSLSDHVGSMFTTRDRDNDGANYNCARNELGGWWLLKCGFSHLNGKYHKDGFSSNHNGIAWGTWKKYDYTISLTFSQMMIRPNFQ